MRDYYLNLYKDIWNWLWSHRFWCFNAAVIYALLQPLAILNSPVAAQTVSPVNPLLQPVSLVQPLQDTAPPEVDKVPDLPPPAPVAPPVQSVSGNCQTYWSGDYYLDNIIRFESGGNSCATNYLGCFGLLQACPGEPLRAACGGNPACQIAWFQQNKTGGRSWAQVWQHELDYGWW